MREPSFWWREQSVIATLLQPLAMLYGAAVARRLRQAGCSAGVPVLCVGNLTVGGAGKTPTAIAIARLLLECGQHPFFLTRGYGGRLIGPLRVAPKLHRAIDVGDEPLLLAAVAPTIVGRDRAAGAEMARAQGASVLVLDDGLQNPSLTKDFALVVIDTRRAIGNGRLLPAGPLRVPVEAQLDRADAVLAIGPDSLSAGLAEAAAARAMPILHGMLEPERDTVATLACRKYLAFAGIADPEKFFATLAAAGIDAPIRHGFADHHRYTATDAAALIGEAEQQRLGLITTEKDLMRMRGDRQAAALAGRVQTLPVTLRLEDQEAFRGLILSRLRRIDGLSTSPVIRDGAAGPLPA